MWDGNAKQVDSFFREGTGTTYPLLLNGSAVGNSYNLGRDYYVVVDHEGIVRYRSSGSLGGRLDPPAIRASIEVALAALPMPEVEEEAPTDVREISTVLPESFALEANYPNPFNAATTINFSLPTAGTASLRLYNSGGLEVRELLGRFLPAGQYSVSWDGRNEAGKTLASGVYFYRLEVAGQTQIRKMLLLQ